MARILQTIEEREKRSSVKLAAEVAGHKQEDINDRTSLRRCELPNGLEIAYQTKAELTHFYEDIFEKQVYLRHGISLSEGECVFDVGANIGLFTLFCHRKVNHLRIYAFEPAPPLFRALSFNTTLHRVNSILFNYGISHEPRNATFTFYPQSSGMSSFYADKQEEKDALRAIMRNQLEAGMEGMKELMRHAEDFLEERFKSEIFDCRLRPLSEVIQEQGIERIDLLKVDVQKSELDVLAGIEAADWPKIKQIVIEVHDLGGRLNKITSLLKQRGFNVKIEQDAMYEGSVLYNLFATKPFSKVASSLPQLIETQTKLPSFQHIQGRAQKQAAVIDQRKQQMESRRKRV